MAVVLQEQGYLDLLEGHLDGAGANFQESLPIARERGDARKIGEGLDCLADLAVAACKPSASRLQAVCKPSRSLRLEAWAEAYREVIGVVGPPSLTAGGLTAARSDLIGCVTGLGSPLRPLPVRKDGQ
jgi:hypothetical protein